MGFCQWFRYFNDRFKFTHVAEIKLSINVQAIQIPITKMVFIRLLTIKDTMASGMNLWTPPAFGQMLSVWKGRLQKSNQVLKRAVYITCEKIKMTEVLCMKENN